MASTAAGQPLVERRIDEPRWRRRAARSLLLRHLGRMTTRPPNPLPRAGLRGSTGRGRLPAMTRSSRIRSVMRRSVHQAEVLGRAGVRDAQDVGPRLTGEAGLPFRGGTWGRGGSRAASPSAARRWSARRLRSPRRADHGGAAAERPPRKRRSSWYCPGWSCLKSSGWRRGRSTIRGPPTSGASIWLEREHQVRRWRSARTCACIQRRRCPGFRGPGHLLADPSSRRSRAGVLGPKRRRAAAPATAVRRNRTGGGQGPQQVDPVGADAVERAPMLSRLMMTLGSMRLLGGCPALHGRQQPPAPAGHRASSRPAIGQSRRSQAPEDSSPWKRRPWWCARRQLANPGQALAHEELVPHSETSSTSSTSGSMSVARAKARRANMPDE